MRKNVFGRKFKRDKNQRKALLRSLMSSLVLEEKIRTTEAKAKAIKSQVEKLVTKAKKNGKGSWNLLQKHLIPNAIDKLISEIAPRFTEREGGYTRIVRLGQRIDSAPMVIMEWVENTSKLKVQSSKLDESEIIEIQKGNKTEALGIPERLSESVAGKILKGKNKKLETQEVKKETKTEKTDKKAAKSKTKVKK